MNKKIFTEEEIKQLSQNRNILKCSSKAITYNKKFKVFAVKEYEKGKTTTQIFEDAGFDLDIIGKDIPQARIRAWKKIYREKGKQGLLNETRGSNGGRLKKTINENDKEILKMKVAYLEAENSFLRKMRQQQE
jgi:hypothetical protein